MPRSSYVAVAVLALAGCATEPVSNEMARHVGPAALLAPQIAQRRPGAHAVTIKRDAGMMGAACSVRVYVDGAPVADLGAGEKVVVYLTEAEHIFSARPNGVCAGGMSEARLSVKAGQALNVRVARGTGGEFFLNPTAF